MTFSNSSYSKSALSLSLKSALSSSSNFARSSSSNTSVGSSTSSRVLEGAARRGYTTNRDCQAALARAGWSKKQQKAGKKATGTDRPYYTVISVQSPTRSPSPSRSSSTAQSDTESDYSDSIMARNLRDAVNFLTSFGCTVTFPAIPASTNTVPGRPGTPNQRPRQPHPPSQANARTDPFDDALDLVRSNGGTVVIPPQPQPARPVVRCDVQGCGQTFASGDALDDHREDHPFCRRCGEFYVDYSHDEHMRRRHGHNA